MKGEFIRVRVGVDGFSDSNSYDRWCASGICCGFVESDRADQTRNSYDTRMWAPVTRTKRDVLAVLTTVLNTLQPIRPTSNARNNGRLRTPESAQQYHLADSRFLIPVDEGYGTRPCRAALTTKDSAGATRRRVVLATSVTTVYTVCPPLTACKTNLPSPPIPVAMTEKTVRGGREERCMRLLLPHRCFRLFLLPTPLCDVEYLVFLRGGAHRKL